MKSFSFQKDQNKIISAQKVLEKTSSSNVNPFFEYINNIKPSNSLSHQQLSKNLSPSSPSISIHPLVPNERKDSIPVSDPRKIYAPVKPSISQNLVADSKKTQLQNSSRIENLRQKRSRSRQNRKSRNRQNSEEAFGKQKKDQHYHKTKLCPLYEKGQCKKGTDCNFAHGFKELRGLPNFYKTKICLAFQRGQCKKSTKQCKYAHGQRQLRNLKHDAGYSNTVSGYNDKKDKQDRNNRNKKDRNSQSVHRNDKNQKNSYHRESSQDRRKDKKSDPKDALYYKKDIPLNKQYEKFLYGKSDFKTSQTQSKSFIYTSDSMYMIPNPTLNPPPTSLPINPYQVDVYSMNLGKSVETIVPVMAPQKYQEFQRNFKEPQKQLYSYREQNPLSYNDKNSPVYYKSRNAYQNEKDFLPQKNNYSESFYPVATVSNQGYNKSEYSGYYQNPIDSMQDFSKDPYTSLNKGGFVEKPYLNEDKSSYPKDSRFPGSSQYSPMPSQRTVPSYPIGQPGQQNQSIYRNDSIYSVPSYNKADTQNMGGFSNRNPSGLYPSNFSNNGVYDLYPALDTNVNQIPKSLPYSHEKSRYSGFSNFIQK